MKIIGIENRYVPKITDNAIITNTAVSKSFENKDCFLYAIIKQKNDDPHRKVRTFSYRTDMYTKEVFSDFSSLDDDGSSLKKDYEVLEWVENKQPWRSMELTYDEIDGFLTQLRNANVVPEGLTDTQKYNIEMSLMFMNLRNQEQPWGYGQVWRLATTEDLKKEVSL